MGDFENALLPSESYYSSDGSTESVTFPRVGDEVLGKRRIVVHCNQSTSIPKIDYQPQPEQPADPVTSSSGSCDPATNRSGSLEVGKFEEVEEFAGSALAQGLEEEVRNEYLALCKRLMCLPHDGETAFYFRTAGIPLMVDVFRQLKTVDVRKEELTSIQHSLLLLKDYGFNCKYLQFVLEKLLSAQKSFKDCEKEKRELQARMAKVQERFKAIDQNCSMFQGTLR